MQLLIQNPGVAPVEGYTLLGVSTSRGCGVEGVIGQFGSGAKHAINVLLRAGISVIIYCGKTRLEFITRDEPIDDGLVQKTVTRVVCKMGGTSTRTIDLGWVLDFGAIDWRDVDMALREFISNAIDRTIREEGDFIAAIRDKRLQVQPVDDSSARARDGFTRVYVEMHDKVARYYEELPRRFLHFSDKPEQVKQSILPKANRNLSPNTLTAMIYREGVFVREISETSDCSLFDYNFRASELAIDECRNSSEYTVRAACAHLMRRANKDILATIFQSLLRCETTFESGLDSYYLSPSVNPAPEQQKNWQEAWQTVAGNAVMCNNVASLVEFVERKGLAARAVSAASWTTAAGRFGIPTNFSLLNADELKGREVIDATPSAEEAVNTVWKWLEEMHLTDGKAKPPVQCFRSIMNAESELLGYCDDGKVFLREDVALEGVNKYLLKAAFEEVSHYVTGSTDKSRDFQNFLIDFAVELASCHYATFVG